MSYISCGEEPGRAVITILKSRLSLVIVPSQNGNNKRGQHHQQRKAAAKGSNSRREGRQEFEGQGYVARIQTHTAPQASRRGLDVRGDGPRLSGGGDVGEKCGGENGAARGLDGVEGTQGGLGDWGRLWTWAGLRKVRLLH